MPPLHLPQVQSLRDAVIAVINQPQGRQPTRFIQATQYGNAPNLVQVCTNLIQSPDAVAYVEKEITGGVPNLLTIEDFICLQGHTWGFSPTAIQTACAGAQHYDNVAGLGHPRYL